MAAARVGWAILGCGRVADRRIAPAVRRSASAELIGFCSRDPARAADYAGRHGAPRAYAALNEALSDPAVQAVYVATPNHLHAEHAAACLAAGRHVLVDKPLALSVEAARQMISEARRAGRTLGVMHQQRFHPANLHLMRLVREGVLGAVRLVRIQIGIWYPPGDNWRLDPARSGGGAAMDLGPHALDLMLQVAGPVSGARATIANLAFEYPVEDYAHLQLEFAGGAAGSLDLGYCMHAYGGRIEVYGANGTFTADGSLQSTSSYRTSLRLAGAAGPTDLTQEGYPDVFTDAMTDFSDAIHDGRRPAVTAEDGLAVMEVLDSTYRPKLRHGATPHREGHLAIDEINQS